MVMTIGVVGVACWTASTAWVSEMAIASSVLSQKFVVQNERYYR
jgi:hypothetical protein